jgi:hypothetical protein
MPNSSAYNFYFPRSTPCLNKLEDKGFGILSQSWTDGDENQAYKLDYQLNSITIFKIFEDPISLLPGYYRI